MLCSFLVYNVLVRHVRPLRGIRRVSAPGTIVLLDWYRSRPRGLDFEHRFCIRTSWSSCPRSWKSPGSRALSASECPSLSAPRPGGEAGSQRSRCRPRKEGQGLSQPGRAPFTLRGDRQRSAHQLRPHGGCRVPPSPRGPSGPTLLGKGALCRQPGASQHLPGKAASEPFHGEENTGYYSPAALRKDLGAPVSRTERHPETPL